MYMDVYSLYFSKVSYDEQKIYHMNTQVGNSVGNDNIIYRSPVRMVGIGWAGSFDQPSHVGTTTSRTAVVPSVRHPKELAPSKWLVVY